MAEAFRPLRPHVRLRIGVTGHRPGPKLPEERIGPIRETVDKVLAAVDAATRDVIARSVGGLVEAPLELTIVSALAEGADRLVAEAGLTAGYGLDAVLPFAREEYGRDFENQASRGIFASLLTRASSVFELDGDRNQSERAYEAAGIVTLANCDLLIAIWDRSDAAGVGGTELIVERAVNEQIPVVLIEPAEPTRATLLWMGDDKLTPASVRKEHMKRRDAFAEMNRVVEILIALPTGEPREHLAAYLREKEKRWIFGPWHALLLFCFSGRKLRETDFHVPRYLDATRQNWADYLSLVKRNDRVTNVIDQILLPAFAAADNLSIRYARDYRSVYVFNFFAAATVATLAVIGLVLHENEWHSIVRITESIEFILIGVVIVYWLVGHKRQWHRRWLEYRRLAECLRHMRLLALTVSVGPTPRPGNSPEADSDWVDWYARSIRRLLPLPQQKVNGEYIELIKAATDQPELRGQISYHQQNAALMETLDHRLHMLGSILFLATAVALVVLLVFPLGHNLKTFLILLTVVFPIFGSAFSAIRVHGDFGTVARRSARTATRLTVIEQALAGEQLTFARLADRVEMASDMMMDDLLEWQLMFRTRPLSLPV